MHLDIRTTAERILSASTTNECARLKTLLSDYTSARAAVCPFSSGMEEEQLDLLDAVSEHLQVNAVGDHSMDSPTRATLQTLLEQLCRSAQTRL
jgi:hypothetical protein